MRIDQGITGTGGMVEWANPEMVDLTRMTECAIAAGDLFLELRTVRVRMAILAGMGCACKASCLQRRVWLVALNAGHRRVSTQELILLSVDLMPKR